MRKNPMPLLSVLLLAACSTAHMDAQWRDAQRADPVPPGSKVFIACDAAEQTLQRICLDKLAAQLRLMGAEPVLPGSQSFDSALAAARAAGTPWMIVATIRLNPVVVAEQRPSFGFGVGGGRGGFGSGVGIQFPFPGTTTAVTPSNNYTSDTAITQVGSGKLRWSGKASSMADEIDKQLQGLMKVTLEAARKDGAL
ncbi:MAG: hypothetical protein QM776_08925 [Rhodocyclaceae bacterium]